MTPTPVYEQVREGVIAVDTEYIRPHMDASHLIVDEGRAAFVDAGTSFSVPNLLRALAAQDLDVNDVDYLVLTHIHLDHAGGAGQLTAALPRARVVMHPRGTAHMIDPTVLIAATKAVYGEARFAREYGEILPIPKERVDVAEDGVSLRLGRRTLQLIHTPGHALHHLCVVDRDRGEVFAGDTFGVSYRELDSAAGEFIFPTTSPTQFDPQQLHASIDRILSFAPQSVYLTHYGRVGQPEKLGRDLHADIDAFVGMARSVAATPNPVEALGTLLFDYLSRRLDAQGVAVGVEQRHAVLDGDVSLNAAGLVAWLTRRKA
jgi:glyoxylase-like metal-dependent hydrolase (beta-lactamase superfamily II)